MSGNTEKFMNIKTLFFGLLIGLILSLLFFNIVGSNTKEVEEIDIVNVDNIISETVIETIEEEIKEEYPIRIREENPQEVECLALNIYHEARGSSFADRIAVSDVVLNRVQDRRYPNTVCGVVKQGKISEWHLKNNGTEVPLRNKCQFSWYCDGQSDEPLDSESWLHAEHLANRMYYYDDYRGLTEGATHYHATYVSPSWAKHFQLICRIGNHVYYRSVH